MSSADGAENFVFTCVRDASQKGGGVAGVALPLHRVLSEKASRYRLVYEFGEYSNREKGSDILWGAPILRFEGSSMYTDCGHHSRYEPVVRR